MCSKATPVGEVPNWVGEVRSAQLVTFEPLVFSQPNGSVTIVTPRALQITRTSSFSTTAILLRGSS